MLPSLSKSITLPPLPPHTVLSIPVLPNMLQTCPLDSSQSSFISNILPVASADNPSSAVPTLCYEAAGSLPANLVVPTDAPTPHSDIDLPEPLPTDIPVATEPVTTRARQILPPCHSMQTRAKCGIFKPKTYAAVVKQPAPGLKHNEPTTAKQALQNPHWLRAMQEEYDALMKNHT